MSAPSRPIPRPEIMDLPPYQGGRESVEGIANPHKLSANESAMGASPAAIAAYRACADNLAVYPDGGAVKLRAALATRNGIDADRIVCGNGSDDILALLAQAYLDKGDEAIHSAHGFLIYKLVARAAGGVPVAVPEVNLTAQVDGMLAAVTPRTRIVYLANPNNPTGTMLPRSEIQRLHAGLPDDVILVLDGAYAEFVDPAIYPDGFDMVHAAPNVVTTRTFSKAYGLAALRLGWGYCAPEVAAVLNRLRGPFNVNAPAAAAAIAALEDTAFLDAAIAHNTQWRDWLHQQIAALGFEVVPSEANFLLIRFPKLAGQTAQDADAFMCARGVIPRVVAAYGLPDSLRLSVGNEAGNRAAVEALRAFAETA